MSFYSQKPSSIQYTKDVIDELEKRTGKKREVLEDIFKINLKYIHETVNNSTEILINFPRLGKMRLNYYFILSFYKVVRKTELKKQVKDKIERLKSIIHKSNKLRNFNKPSIYMLYRSLTKDYASNIMKIFYKCWFVAEENHNQYHAKYFK